MIAGNFVDEHFRALGLGGSNDETNRDIAHVKCAKLKTMEDIARINKAKAQKRAHHGVKDVKGKPLQSRNDLSGKQPKKKAYEPPVGQTALMRRGFVPASEAGGKKR